MARRTLAEEEDHHHRILQVDQAWEGRIGRDRHLRRKMDTVASEVVLDTLDLVAAGSPAENGTVEPDQASEADSDEPDEKKRKLQVCC